MVKINGNCFLYWCIMGCVENHINNNYIDKWYIMKGGK